MYIHTQNHVHVLQNNILHKNKNKNGNLFKRDFCWNELSGKQGAWRDLLTLTSLRLLLLLSCCAASLALLAPLYVLVVFPSGRNKLQCPSSSALAPPLMCTYLMPERKAFVPPRLCEHAHLPGMRSEEEGGDDTSFFALSRKRREEELDEMQDIGSRVLRRRCSTLVGSTKGVPERRRSCSAASKVVQAFIFWELLFFSVP